MASPLFQFGFKEPRANQIRTEKDVAAVEVLMETLASDASPLFRDLLDRGLVNEASFSYEYFEGNGYATPMFSGESKDPQAVAKSILQEVRRFQKEGIPPEAFERSKRCLYGEIVSALNSTGNIANGLSNMELRGRELFTYIDALARLRPEDAEEKLQQIFLEEQSVLSVILPLEP